jgi:hypothetical protein
MEGDGETEIGGEQTQGKQRRMKNILNGKIRVPEAYKRAAEPCFTTNMRKIL